MDWKYGSQSDGRGGIIPNEIVSEFIELAIKDDAGEVRRMLAHRPALASCRDRSGCTPLARCSFYGSLGAIRELIPFSDLNARSDLGDTALMRAAVEGRDEAVRLLLPGSDATLKDRAGNTALMMASIWGTIACVDLLLPVSDVEAVGFWQGKRLDAEAGAREAHRWDIAERLAIYKAAQKEREELDLAAARGAARGSAPRV